MSVCAALLRLNPPVPLHCVVSNFTTSNTLGHLPYPSRARNSTRFHCVRGCLRVSAQNHQKITHGVDLVPLHWATSWTEPPFSSSSIFLLPSSGPGSTLPQEVQQVTQSFDRSMVKTLVLQQAQNSCSFRLLYLSNRLLLPTSSRGLRSISPDHPQISTTCPVPSCLRTLPLCMHLLE